MKYTEMRAEFLPICMVRKNFIQGEIPSYSYEDYLRDFVNCSEYFLKKSNEKPYRKPDSEAHRECDCISEQYLLDFKLFASQSKIYAKNKFSDRIEVEQDSISYCKPKELSRREQCECSIPYATFRNISCDELIEIREKKEKEDVLEKDVSQIIKIFETKKNIMLFFPYNFNFDSNDNFEQGRKLAIDGLNADFKYLFQYRMDRLPEYDTYVSFIYEKENFVITKWTGDKLEFVEMIPVYRSSLYCELWHIAEG